MLPAACVGIPTLFQVLYEVDAQVVLSSHRLPGVEPEPVAFSPLYLHTPASFSAVQKHTNTHTHTLLLYCAKSPLQSLLLIQDR